MAGLLMVAILAGAGAGYLIGNANERTVTSITTITTTSTATVTYVSTGFLTTTTTVTGTVRSTNTVPSLELFGSVSPPAMASGQNVSLTLGIYNPLPTTVSVNVSSFADPSVFPCGVSGSPDAWDFFSGHVTFSNLSSATPLLLYNASIVFPCTAPFNSTFTFQPGSDVAIVQLLQVANSTMTLNWSHTYNYSGYWVPSSNGNHKLQAFPPGQYTALVFDVWGQQQLEYFEVTP